MGVAVGLVFIISLVGFIKIAPSFPFETTIPHVQQAEEVTEAVPEEERKDEFLELSEKFEGILPMSLSLALTFTCIRIGIKFIRSVN